MGNSSGAYLGIQINNNQGDICSGKSIVGKFFLDVRKDNVLADSLNIVFIGTEKTKVEYEESESYTEHDSEGKVVTKTRSITRHAYESSEFLRIECVVARFNGQVERGRYEFPYEILVPKGLPGKQGI